MQIEVLRIKYRLNGVEYTEIGASEAPITLERVQEYLQHGLTSFDEYEKKEAKPLEHPDVVLLEAEAQHLDMATMLPVRRQLYPIVAQSGDLAGESDGEVR